MPHTRPHFLHIGPEKTGTSWLYWMLRQHPGVHVNPVKEIRYFYEAFAFPGESLRGRLGNGDWHNQTYRKHLKERLKSYLAHPWEVVRSPDRLAWDCSYLFGSRTDEWFEGLFRHAGSKITGDFSPQTIQLPPEEVVRISRDWPTTKVILTLREPIEWIWSFAKMTVLQGRDLADVGDDEFLEFFSGHAVSYYPLERTISAWESAFAGRFQLLFFDEMAADPLGFLKNVCTFLGLGVGPLAEFQGISEKRYAGRKVALPDRFRPVLVEMYRDQVRELAERYGGYPEQWLDRYERR